MPAPSIRSKARERCRQRYRQRRSEGLCVKCPNPAPEGALCDACREHQRPRVARHNSLVLLRGALRRVVESGVDPGDVADVVVSELRLLAMERSDA